MRLFFSHTIFENELIVFLNFFLQQLVICKELEEGLRTHFNFKPYFLILSSNLNVVRILLSICHQVGKLAA